MTDQTKLGDVLSRLGERDVRFNIVDGGLETLQGRTYGKLTLELLGDTANIETVIEQLTSVTLVQEVRA